MLQIDKQKLNLTIAEKCMSIDEIARTSGISCVTITRVKNGTQIPRPKTIGMLAKALGVTIESIIK